MKIYFSLYLFLVTLIFSSCCSKYKSYEVPVLKINYHGDFGGYQVYHIRTTLDYSEIIDTTFESDYWENQPSNEGIKLLFELKESNYNHILVTLDGSTIDTITQIGIERDKCEKIETQHYYWNGVYSEDTVKNIYK